MLRLVIVTLGGAAILGWAAGGGLATPDTARSASARAASPDDRQTPRPAPASITIDRGWNDHYFVNGDIAGKPLRFVVDTGASTVALSRGDAMAVGLDVDRLAFDHEAMTANGRVRVAHVHLGRLRIGDIELSDVSADVLDVPDTGVALLGQSFLGRIDRVSIENGRMVLTKL